MQTPTFPLHLTLTGCVAVALSLGACGSDDANPAASGADTETSGAEDTESPEPQPQPEPSGGTTTSADDSGTTEPGSGEASSTGEELEEPPTVLSTSPPNGARGVPVDAVIVVTFSEPMDQAATEAAWESEDLPADAVTMTWNAAGDVLTVTPHEPLTYAEGDDPDVLEPHMYAVALNASAKNLTGHSLEEPITLEFGTVRSIVYSEVPNEPDLTGHLLDGSITPNTNLIWIGDNATNSAYKGFVSIDLSTLPPDIIEFSSAHLFVNQTGVPLGAPYADLGVVYALPVDFETIGPDAFSATPWIDVGLLFSTEASPGWRTLDVLGFVEQAYAGNTGLSQYRLEFSSATDGDGVPDIAAFATETATIVVNYLVP